MGVDNGGIHDRWLENDRNVKALEAYAQSGDGYCFQTHDLGPTSPICTARFGFQLGHLDRHAS